MSSFEWADHRRRQTGIYQEITRDAVQVAGGADPVAILRASGG
jgi:hypothetical protein